MSLTRPDIWQLPPPQKPVMAETSPLSLERICCSNNPYEFTHRPRNYQNLSALNKVKGCCSCFETLSVLFTEIVNLSLATESIPRGLKTALQIQPLKSQRITKVNLDSWEDHCPIFFCIYLVTERAVCLQLVKCIGTNDPGETFQSAYNSIYSSWWYFESDW